MKRKYIGSVRRGLAIFALATGLGPIVESATLSLQTSLFVSDSQIEIGESFDLVVAIQTEFFPLELSSFEFVFQSLDGGFELLGVTALQPLDTSLSLLPTVLGLSFGGVELSGAPLELVSLQLAAVGPAGIHEVSVSGLLETGAGAYFFDPQFNDFEGDIARTAMLEIVDPTARVPDSAATGILFLIGLGGLAAARGQRTLQSRRGDR